MTYEKASDIYDAVEATRHELRLHFYRAAARYAAIRVEWLLSDFEGRREIEKQRTTCHNALIDALNILARNLANEGHNVLWRRDIGDDRKRIGDFAVFLVARLGIQAR